MKMLRIAVGTTSEQKLGYLKEVLEEIGIKAKLVPAEVESGVAEQPTSEEETRQGSISRAKGALKANPDSDFGLGIEVGYHQHILKEGKYLGEYVRKYQEGVNEPVANYIRELVRGRRPLIMEATRNALLIYLEKTK